MVVYCSVPQCNTYHGETGTSFYYYPRDRKARKEWLVRLKMSKANTKSSRVCSKHFDESDFVYPVGSKMFGWKRRWLAPGAVPSKRLPIRPVEAKCTKPPPSAPEQILPTPMDGITCLDDCNQVSICRIQQEERRNNTIVVKQEPADTSGASTCVSLPWEAAVGLTSSGGERRNDGQTATVLGKEESPEEILPTLAGERLCSEDRGTSSASQTQLEEHWDNHIVVKQEPEEASVTSTCEGWDPEAAGTLSSQREHPDECRTDGVAVKQEPEEILSSPVGDCSYDEDCGEVSPSKLDPHTVGHTVEAPFECSARPSAPLQKEPLVAPDKHHADEKPYKCSGCDKRFGKKTALDSHWQVHTETKRFKCSLCSRTFKWRASLYYHQRSDEVKGADALPFRYTVCREDGTDVALAASSGSNTPSIIRRDEGPFKCPICFKAFQKKYYLTVHNKVHTGERPFKCPACAKAFKSKWTLSCHAKTHVNNGSFKCPTCPEAFRSKSQLSIHQGTHLDETPFRFSTSLKSFGRKCTLVATGQAQK